MSSSRKSRERKGPQREGSAKPSSRKPRPWAGWRFALAASALCALVLIAYGNSIRNGFVWDDHEQIEMNPALKAGTPLTRLFASDVRFVARDTSVRTPAYRPMQMLTYRMVMAIAGASPAAFHVCSIALAMGGTLAAFAVFWFATGKIMPAFVSAALFAVHPVHTEAVDWIAASPDLGCGFFMLLAMALFLAGRSGSIQNAPERSSVFGAVSGRLLLVLSLVSYAIALLWKETAVVLPVLIGAYVFAVQTDAGGRMRSALRASAPYWAVLVAYLVLRVRVLGSLATGARNWALTPGQFLLTDLDLMTSYWGELVFPLRLNAYYHFSPVRSVADPRAMIAIGFVACGIAGLIYLVRRAPLCAFAALWVGITLLPALDVNAVGRNAFAERYLYLPSAGFCLLLTLCVGWLMSLIPAKAQKPLGICLFILVVGALTAETIGRNSDWKDDGTLFSKTLGSSPDAPLVRLMAAKAESVDSPVSATAEENYLEAIRLARQEIPPDRLDLVRACEGAAWLYADREDYPRAVAMLAQAREVAPGDTELDSEEGVIRARAGQWKEAEPLLEKAFVSQPENESVLSALGMVAWQLHHDAAGGEKWFLKAFAVHSKDDDFSASLHNNLGAIYAESDDFARAIEQFRFAVAISPGNPEYHANLASALGASKRYDEARSEAQAALRIDPGYPSALAVLRNIESK